ncbi:MAG: hypothetical protein ACXVBH_15140, partial [Flavisolibacter sp.]
MPKEILLQRLQANQSKQALPDKENAQGFIDNLFDFLFYSGGCEPKDLDKQYDDLKDQLSQLVAACSEVDEVRASN